MKRDEKHTQRHIVTGDVSQERDMAQKKRVIAVSLIFFFSLIFSNANIRHLLDSLVSALAVYATAFGSKRSLAPMKTDRK